MLALLRALLANHAAAIRAEFPTRGEQQFPQEGHFCLSR
jgi:hypothetical protein